MDAAFADPDALVSTAWLSERLGKPGLVVIDITKYLPNEGRDGRAEYLAAHIPSALYLDIDVVADRGTDLPHMLPSPAGFAAAMEGFGVSNGHHVVFYDQKGMASAARGWWMMRVFGHDAASVLDGGLPRWRAHGLPVEAGEPPPPRPAVFAPAFRPWLVADRHRVAGAIATGAERIIDARPRGRFDGTAPEPRPGLRPGHMPGASSLPHLSLLNDDATFRAPEALRALLAAAGADGARPVIASCGSGVTACAIALAARLAGLPDIAVYDGSWAEWGGRTDTPVERTDA